MTIDLHWLHPSDIVWSGVSEKSVLEEIVQHAWEMGEKQLRLIHGHGRNRGITPGFVNTNTGYFGLEIRRALRHNTTLRNWIYHTSLDCSDKGVTAIGLKPNPAPSRTSLDVDIISAERVVE